MSKLKFSVVIDMPDGAEPTLVRQYIEDTLYGSWWQFEGEGPELWDAPSVRVRMLKPPRGDLVTPSTHGR